MNESVELEIIKNEEFPEQTQLYQLDDGTLFYWKMYPRPSRLYVMSGCSEIDAQVPDDIEYLYAHGNSLYLASNTKIFLAILRPPRAIIVYFHRDVLQDETVHAGGSLTRKRDGNKCTYRYWENPEKDGVVMDATDKELYQKWWSSMHRNRFFYWEVSDTLPYPVLSKLTVHVILLSSSFHVAEHKSETSKFCYVIEKGKLFTFDMETLQGLPPLAIPTMNVSRFTTIAGVCDGVIIMTGWNSAGGDRLVTARLPEGYFDIPDEVNLNSLEGLPEWREENQISQILSATSVSDTESSLASMTMNDDSSANETGSFFSEFLEKFQPISILGQGGYGCVFEAEFKLIKRRYAVKRIPLKRETDVGNALREVMALDSFEHPGIVRYNSSWLEKPPPFWQRSSDEKILVALNYEGSFDYKDDCTFLYIQMQLCKSTLADWLSANDQRDPGRMKSWFKQTVCAVQYIHKQNTMHRDLKPSNILLVSDDVLKICDLGIATVIENGEGALQWRTDIGSPLYRSPEQNMIYDERVDIFPLGLILIELCIVMTEKRRFEVFNDIRCGVPIEHLKMEPSALDLVTKLTKLDRSQRPSLDEILSHPFCDEQ